MQIFGQVWLWSLGSFLFGVLFTWLLLVRPMRKRVIELEEAGENRPREVKQPTRVAEPVGPPTGKEADRFLDDLFNTPKATPQPQGTPHQPIRPPQLPPPPMPASAQPGLTAPPELPPPPMTIAAQPGLGSPQDQPSPFAPQPFSSRLDPQAPPEPPIPDESDTELSDSPFRQFTESTTVFVPPADLRMPEKAESSGDDWFAKEEDPDPHLITDVEDDEQVDARGTIFAQHTTPIPDGMIRSQDHEPDPAQQYDPPLPEAAQSYEPAAAGSAQHYDPPLPEPVQSYESAAAGSAQHYDPPLPDPAQNYQPEVTQHFDPPLPEPGHSYEPQAAHFESGQHFEEPSQPIKPPKLPEPEPVPHYDPSLPDPEQNYEPQPAPHYQPEATQHFDSELPDRIEPPKLPDPDPVIPVEPGPTQRFEPVAPPADAEPQHDSSRSLFEPVLPVPGEQGEEAGDEFVPPGPFGPGSAMPLPGGGAPAPEFSVKASVTALRYCTQDNPQFDRIVAEVWFRSPSDAERVGFRVLS
ncbi:hypothetical protein LWC34_22900 [Kibdelosporangium philippinense]|uniref:Uncharacterized protein n=1 Tax=Kibdelosporangium philippinense TaxID=211113 RepID=A0ABS8ZCS5_9PSEU|nr:hypothetical protein [Kibdelosporangium philippinense]MCE7005654.1 hypothetical protein [Kibdelosporangium philippinense]